MASLARCRCQKQTAFRIKEYDGHLALIGDKRQRQFTQRCSENCGLTLPCGRTRWQKSLWQPAPYLAVKIRLLRCRLMCAISTFISWSNVLIVLSNRQIKVAVSTAAKRYVLVDQAMVNNQQQRSTVRKYCVVHISACCAARHTYASPTCMTGTLHVHPPAYSWYSWHYHHRKHSGSLTQHTLYHTWPACSAGS